MLRDHPCLPATRRLRRRRAVGEAWPDLPTVVLQGRDDFFLTDRDLAWLRGHPDLDLRLLDPEHFVSFRDPGVVAGQVLEHVTRDR